MSNSSNTVCIQTYSTIAEAEMAKGILESNGIHAMVSADNIGGLIASLDLTGGVKLLVLEEFAKRANEILDETTK